MNKPVTNNRGKNGLLLAVGLLIGATAFSAAAQDRSYARQNSESRSLGSERSRGAAQAVYADKRGDSRSRSRGDSRGNRYNPAQSNQRYDGDHRGSTSRNYGGHDNRYSSDRHGNDYRRHAPAYGAKDYRSGGHRSHDYRPRYNQYNQHNRHGSWRTPSWRNQWHHGWSGHGYRASSRYYYPSGYSSFRWSIGYVLPRAFYRSNYYVNYDAYGLAPPPYGARWLRVDSDLLLVDIASYEIIEVLRGFYYY